MSDRERWIVYPLLFLALGASLRDKIVKQTQSNVVLCRTLVCQDLLVVDEDNRRMVAIGSDEIAVEDSSESSGDAIGRIEVYQTVGNAQFPIARIGAVTLLPGMEEVERRAASAASRVFENLLNALRQQWNAPRGDSSGEIPQGVPPDPQPGPEAELQPVLPQAGQGVAAIDIG